MKVVFFFAAFIPLFLYQGDGCGSSNNKESIVSSKTAQSSALPPPTETNGKKWPWLQQSNTEKSIKSGKEGNSDTSIVDKEIPPQTKHAIRPSSGIAEIQKSSINFNPEIMKHPSRQQTKDTSQQRPPSSNSHQDTSIVEEKVETQNNEGDASRYTNPPQHQQFAASDEEYNKQPQRTKVNPEIGSTHHGVDKETEEQPEYIDKAKLGEDISESSQTEADEYGDSSSYPNPPSILDRNDMPHHNQMSEKENVEQPRTKVNAPEKTRQEETHDVQMDHENGETALNLYGVKNGVESELSETMQGDSSNPPAVVDKYMPPHTNNAESPQSQESSSDILGESGQEALSQQQSPATSQNENDKLELHTFDASQTVTEKEIQYGDQDVTAKGTMMRLFETPAQVLGAHKAYRKYLTVLEWDTNLAEFAKKNAAKCHKYPFSYLHENVKDVPGFSTIGENRYFDSGLSPRVSTATELWSKSYYASTYGLAQQQVSAARDYLAQVGSTLGAYSVTARLYNTFSSPQKQLRMLVAVGPNAKIQMPNLKDGKKGNDEVLHKNGKNIAYTASTAQRAKASKGHTAPQVAIDQALYLHQYAIVTRSFIHT